MNNIQHLNIDEQLLKLSKSTFRSSFKLKDKDINYIDSKGFDTIKQHAYDFINARIKPMIIPNDGKQTPTKGHPVFIAQHACACCCRSCLYKWYKIPQGRELNQEEVDLIVKVLMIWIEKQHSLHKS
ncbi:MAG: DUF4186 domain-containing protein [Clostridia bacterium]|nr:DUF4186 domain-containing protein [Clostridia bacterium]